MQKIELRNKLIQSLIPLYHMEAVGTLTEFLHGELQVLLYLSQNSNLEINPSILSDNLHVSRPRITAALSVLRKKGHVTMEMCEDDRRRMRVKITENGESYVKDRQEKVEKYFDVLVEGLGKENVIDFIRVIELSIDVMDNRTNYP